MFDQYITDLYDNGLRHERVNLRQNSQFSRTPINTAQHGIESISKEVVT